MNGDSPESSGIRSFVAVDLDAPVRQAVNDLQGELRRINADVRWVRPEGLHVTLKFLGSVDPARLERVHAALAADLTRSAGAASERARSRRISQLAPAARRLGRAAR